MVGNQAQSAASARASHLCTTRRAPGLGQHAEMRSRSNSGVRLDGYARLVQQTILCYQVRKDHPKLPSSWHLLSYPIPSRVLRLGS